MPNVSYCVSENEVHYNPLPKPYQGFCKLTLNDGSIVELEGSGELTMDITESYLSDTVSAEIGTLCTSIGESAFFGCTILTSVTIPNSVTSIGEYNQEIKGETNVEIIPVSAWQTAMIDWNSSDWRGVCAIISESGQ